MWVSCAVVAAAVVTAVRAKRERAAQRTPMRSTYSGESGFSTGVKQAGGNDSARRAMRERRGGGADEERGLRKKVLLLLGFPWPFFFLPFPRPRIVPAPLVARRRPAVLASCCGVVGRVVL